MVGYKCLFSGALRLTISIPLRGKTVIFLVHGRGAGGQVVTLEYY